MYFFRPLPKRLFEPPGPPRGAHKCPPILTWCPFWDPGADFEKKGSQNGPLFWTRISKNNEKNIRCAHIVVFLEPTFAPEAPQSTQGLIFIEFSWIWAPFLIARGSLWLIFHGAGLHFSLFWTEFYMGFEHAKNLPESAKNLPRTCREPARTCRDHAENLLANVCRKTPIYNPPTLSERSSVLESLFLFFFRLVS